LVAAALGVGISVFAPRVDADDKPAGAVLQETSPNSPKYEYVGTKKCRMCHVNQFHSFEELPKANAWEALRSGVAPEVKRRAGLDPAADYTADSRCLKCHSTGYEKPGGYVVPKRDNKPSISFAAAREGIGCEACHGPGSGFVEHMQDISSNDRTYRRKELLDAGLRQNPAETCNQCHNNDAICMKGSSAGASEGGLTTPVVDPKDRRGYHDAFPLEHRDPADAAAAPPAKPDRPTP